MFITIGVAGFLLIVVGVSLPFVSVCHVQNLDAVTDEGTKFERRVIVKNRFTTGLYGEWRITRMKYLREGDRFTIFEYNGTPIENNDGGYEFIAEEDAHSEYVRARPA
jgi:hypothetical protein